MSCNFQIIDSEKMKSHAQNKGTENVFLNPKTSKDIKSKKEPKKPVVKKNWIKPYFFYHVFISLPFQNVAWIYIYIYIYGGAG